MLHNFIFFADILDTSRVISEDGKKKVGAVCKAWWLLCLSPIIRSSHWLLRQLSQLWWLPGWSEKVSRLHFSQQ